MEGEKFFNKIPSANRADIERKKLIEMGIITPEESETAKSETPKKEEAPIIELTPEMEIKEEDLFKISEETKKDAWKELPEMKVDKEIEEAKEEFSFDISEPAPAVSDFEDKTTLTPETFGKEETLILYRLLRGKGESAEEVPVDFKLPPEMEKNAADFFKTRSRYVEEWHKHSQTLKMLEKSKGREGDVEYVDAQRYLENADATYKLALERLKRDVVGFKYREKIKEFPEAVVKIGKKKEYAAASASVMVGIAKFINNDLEKMKIERMSKENEREKSGVRKLWEKYKGLSRGKRLLMSAGISAGIGAAFALGPGGWLIAAGVAGHRSLRTLGGGAIAAGLNVLGRKIFGSKFGRERKENLIGETEAVEQEVLAEIEKQRKLSKSEKNKWRMMEIIDQHTDKYGDKLKDIGRRERKTNMIISLASGLIGGISAAGLDWYFSKPKISEVAELAEMKKGTAPISEKTGLMSGAAEVMPGKAGGAAEIIEKLPIGERGPEGAIIDYFKGNPEIAKKFGWDGTRDLNGWAGIKAHQLWFEDAQEALKNPEILEKLKSLGYSQDMDGYGQMMRRIKEGSVVLKPDGTMDLAEGVEYLKAVKNSEVPIESGLPKDENVETLETGIKEKILPKGAWTEESSPVFDESTGKYGRIAEISTEKLLNPLETAQADKQAFDLIDKIRKGELTADKFSNIYADKFGATGGMTPELKANLAKLFENLKDSNPMKRLNAETVFKTIMRRLFAIKRS